jgi:NAD(P)-dependent dehydrogenase (short-subunit alcohol dehydrogenase family)
MRLKGKIAIVTGAAAGIGKGTALRFAREGAVVIVTARDEERARKVVDEIASTDGSASFIRLDVTSESDWEQLTDQVVGRFGRVDILFNNAGVVLVKPLAETTLDEWDRVMTVNVTGSFLGMRQIVPLMAEQGAGSVINASSDSGFLGSAGLCAYGASKGAIRLLTKHIAVEFAARGVRVNSIHPAYVDTEMMEVVAEAAHLSRADLDSYAPLGRTCTVEEVASLVTFLASDESSYCTGAEFLIDGGAIAQ